MAKGTAPGRVRVSLARFKELKKIISRCDRGIQWRDETIQHCHQIIEDFGSFAEMNAIRVIKDRTAERDELDAQRKAARLELKGYG